MIKGNIYTIIVIPLILFFIYISLLFWTLLNSDISLTTVSSVPSVTFSPQYTMPLEKNNMVEGTFTAEDNYLGILQVRFQSFGTVVNDDIFFRLKEKQADKWYYENTYNTKQFFYKHLFPFGFPTINQSKGKQFIFQIQSLHGSLNNAIAIDTEAPIVVSTYQYPKKLLLSNPKILYQFIIKKLLFQGIEKKYVSLLFIYIYILLIYSLCMVVLSEIVPYVKRVQIIEYLKKLFRPYTLLTYILILVDIASFKSTNIFIFIVTALWIFSTIKYKFHHKIHFVNALFLVCLYAFFISLSLEDFAEKTAVWIYIFLVFGAVHSLFEDKVLKKDKILSH